MGMTYELLFQDDEFVCGAIMFATGELGE